MICQNMPGINNALKHILRHCIETAPFEAGNRISFSGFGRSHYRSREIGEALKTLERAMLIHLLYPTTSTSIPLVPDFKKSPRLQFLDTGLLNFITGLQGHFFEHDNLHPFYKEKLAEHIVGQEMLANEMYIYQKPCFWVREKKQSSAEVDFLIQFNQYAIPVVV